MADITGFELARREEEERKAKAKELKEVKTPEIADKEVKPKRKKVEK